MAIIQRGDSAKRKVKHNKTRLISMRNSPADDSTPKS